MDRYVISVGAGRNQVPLIKNLLKRGYRVVAFDKDEHAPGRRYCTYFNNISTWDYEKAIEWLDSLCIKYEGAGCFSYGNAVVTQQKIIKHYGLPASIPSTLYEIFIDKRCLRKILKDKGLSNLKEYDFTTVNDMDNIQYDKTYIVKDNLGGSSKNIFKIKGSELSPLIKSYNLEFKYIIQEYLEGDEYRVVAIIQNKKVKFYALLQRENFYDTLFVGRYTPVFDYNKSFITLVYKVIDTFELVDTLIKIDLIANNKTLEILEIDFSIPGDYFDIIIAPRCYNYNFIDNYINLILGLEVQRQQESGELYYFDYIYNIYEEICIIDYTLINKAIEGLFRENKYILHKIKEAGEKVFYPESNLDAICAVLHNNVNMSNCEINQFINKCLNEGLIE